MIESPLEGLDLSAFLTNASSRTVHYDKFELLISRFADMFNYTYQSTVYHEPNERHSSVYDLYSVINHQGTLTSGHYINISKNNLNNQWYRYDDDLIDKVSSSEVISESSYVLFYQRRNTKLSPDRHWCLRLPAVQKVNFFVFSPY